MQGTPPSPCSVLPRAGRVLSDSTTTARRDRPETGPGKGAVGRGRGKRGGPGGMHLAARLSTGGGVSRAPSEPDRAEHWTRPPKPRPHARPGWPRSRRSGRNPMGTGPAKMHTPDHGCRLTGLPLLLPPARIYLVNRQRLFRSARGRRTVNLPGRDAGEAEPGALDRASRGTRGQHAPRQSGARSA